MPPLFRPLLLLALCASFSLQAAQQCLVIGDSLTKEYEVEFPALFPANPASWDSRNWIEILHERRNTWFDLGRFTGYVDPRLTGHEHNWAFPGATTEEIRTQLNRWQNAWWTVELREQIKDSAERVVVFAGGNDVDSFYGQIYNGTSPTAYINKVRDNLKWIVDYVRSVDSTVPIVLVSVPHLGCAPDIQRQWPTNSVKTARVTAALDSLNNQLAAYAQTKGIGFVPGVYQFTKDIISGPFIMSGLEFYREADADARPRYVFSGDGFHPGTCAHGKIAQMVIAAFNSKYPASPITPLTDQEIVTNILGLTSDIPFQTWIATQGLPDGKNGLKDDPDGDGLSNELEFLLDGGNAAVPSPGLVRPQVVMGAPKKLVWTYRIRSEAANWAVSRPQISSDLVNWANATAGSVVTNPDGSITLSVPLLGRKFVRLKVDR